MKLQRVSRTIRTSTGKFLRGGALQSQASERVEVQRRKKKLFNWGGKHGAKEEDVPGAKTTRYNDRAFCPAVRTGFRQGGCQLVQEQRCA